MSLLISLSHSFPSLQIGAIFEEEQATSRHAQFSSRRPPADILSALEAAAGDVGGTAERLGEKRRVAEDISAASSLQC